MYVRQLKNWWSTFGKIEVVKSIFLIFLYQKEKGHTKKKTKGQLQNGQKNTKLKMLSMEENVSCNLFLRLIFLYYCWFYLIQKQKSPVNRCWSINPICFFSLISQMEIVCWHNNEICFCSQMSDTYSYDIHLKIHSACTMHL